MSLPISVNTSTVTVKISPEIVEVKRTTETPSTMELTNAVAMPAIAEASASAVSAASAISPSVMQTPIPLKFQILSRKLLELGYSEFNKSPCLRAILKNLLIQLASVTDDESTKRSLENFSNKIGKRTKSQSVTDGILAKGIEELVTSREAVAGFDCSNIHYNQREQIKSSLLKSAELLCQLSTYWNLPLETALKSMLPNEDALKAVAHLLRDKGMFYGYITNVGEKIAQELSVFTKKNSVKKQDFSIILQLIIDVLINHPDISSHLAALSSEVQPVIKSLLEPYVIAKKIKNGSHILGPSIDIYFYAALIDAPLLKGLDTQSQGHVPTLSHALLLKCNQFIEKLDKFHLQIQVNKLRIAKQNAQSVVARDESCKGLQRGGFERELSKQRKKEAKKVDNLAAGISKTFDHASSLKLHMNRIEDHLFRNASIIDIKTLQHLINLCKNEAIAIHNSITHEVNRNIISYEALTDEVIDLERTDQKLLEPFLLLPTPTLNHGARPPERLPSMAKKMEYRKMIIEGNEDISIPTTLQTLTRNIDLLQSLQIEAESVIHIAKTLEDLFESDVEKMKETLAKDTADYEERFSLLADELDPPDAKLSLLFTTAERTFITTPPRTSPATDRIITPSPPRISRSGAVSHSPPFTSNTPPDDRLLAESPPIATSYSRLSPQVFRDAANPIEEFTLDARGQANSIPCQIKHIMMLRSPMDAKRSSLTEESISHLILAAQDIEQLMKALQNKDLPLFRAAASLLMIDTHVAIEQYLKAQLLTTTTDLTDHSLVVLEGMLERRVSPEFHPLLEASDLSIIWARYPEKALQTHSHKRKKTSLIKCIELLNSLKGLETARDQGISDTILSQLQGTLRQTVALLLGPDEAASIESLMEATPASDISYLPRKQNELDKVIGDVEDTLRELCIRTDLNTASVTSLKEATHYLDWIKAAENTLQLDSHKSSSYWIMRLFIGGVDKLFENLYIGATAAHGYGEVRSHNLLSLRKQLFSKSITSTLSEEEIAHIAGFNIGNGLQYPHQQKGVRSAILLKALEYSLSHIGVEEGFSPVRAQMISDWELTLKNQIHLALSIWIKEARSLFYLEGSSEGSAASGRGISA